MTRWEYKFIDATDVAKSGRSLRARSTEDIEAYFNALGQDGWEIVALDFSDVKTVFYGVAKRPIDD